MRFRILLLAAAILLTAGCGSGGSSNPAPGPLSGNWQFSLQRTDSTLNPKTQSGFLLQEKNNVAGSVLYAGPSTGCCCAGVGAVTGSLNGAAVNLNVTPVGLSINLTGTLGSDSSSMSGSYTILPAGCSGPAIAPEAGSWTANLVKPLQGNITGTFSSKALGADLAVSGKIAQGTNSNASTTAPLTGNFNVSNYCFSAASASGTISGTNVTINLSAADGTQLAQVAGILSLDGTSLAGTYHVIPRSANTFPCYEGDSGTVTLTFGQ